MSDFCETTIDRDDVCSSQEICSTNRHSQNVTACSTHVGFDRTLKSYSSDLLSCIDSLREMVARVERRVNSGSF